MVGALSIVCFRAAIKEPEELAYTFFCITVGLGFGAGERGLMVAVTLLILLILVLRGMITRRQSRNGLYIFSVNGRNIKMNDVLKILEAHTETVRPVRVDRYENETSAMFSVVFSSSSGIDAVTEALQQLDSSVRCSCIIDSDLS